MFAANNNQVKIYYLYLFKIMNCILADVTGLLLIFVLFLHIIL